MHETAVGYPGQNVDRRELPHLARELIHQLGLGDADPAVAPEQPGTVLRGVCDLSRCLSEDDRFADAQWALVTGLSLATSWRADTEVVADLHAGLQGLYKAEAQRYQHRAAVLHAAAVDEEEVVLPGARMAPGERTLFTADALRGAYEAATWAHRLAKRLVEDGLFEEATALYERALALRWLLLETGSSDVAKTAHNLALLYEQEGRTDEAHSLWARVGSVIGSPPDQSRRAT